MVCAKPASVYCHQDSAFLCNACYQTIHSANCLSSRHVRTPVCQLCHRSAAAVYCRQDAAYLCTLCDNEVHESNPLPHDRVHVSCCSGVSEL